MKQEKFVAAVERLFKDEQPVELTISKQQLWCLITAVQLACRHPLFTGPTRKIVDEVVNKIAAPLVANDPDLRLLYQMGCDPRFDEKRSEP